MRFLFFSVVTVFLLAKPAMADFSYPVFSKEECQKQLEAAEKDFTLFPYETCGFSDEEEVWNYLAPLASEKQWRRALFEICDHYPESQYGFLYCQKAADLGFGPAQMTIGHIALLQKKPDLASAYYALALQSGHLDQAQINEIAENLAGVYLDENSGFFQPEKGIAFLKQAADNRSALSNNTLGFLHFAGKLSAKENKEDAFKYFWRAILLGCPAAEENLGVFQLERLGKISYETAVRNMLPAAFTCTATSEADINARLEKNNLCQCPALRKNPALFFEKPYFLTLADDDEATLISRTTNKLLHIKEGQKLDDGFIVQEIRPSAVIMQRKNERLIVNMFPKPEECLSFCRQSASLTDRVIKPYHLTFTPQECEDLLYYAGFLVDMHLPFRGKRECTRAQQDAARDIPTDSVLLLMQEKNAPEAAPDDQTLRQLLNQPIATQPDGAEPQPQQAREVAASQKTASQKTPRLRPTHTTNASALLPRQMPALAADSSTGKARRTQHLRQIINRNVRALEAFEQKQAAEEAKKKK